MWLKELKVETFSVKILYIEYKQMVVLLSSLLRSICKDFLQQHHLSFAFIINVKMNVYQYMSKLVWSCNAWHSSMFYICMPLNSVKTISKVSTEGNVIKE